MDYKKAVKMYQGAQEWPRCGQGWGTYPQESEAKSLLDGVATRYAKALMDRAEMARLGVTESEVLEHAHFCAHEDFAIGSLESIASAKAERAAFHAAQRAEIAHWESMTPEQRTAHRAAEQQAAAEKQAAEAPAREAAWLEANAEYAARVDAQIAAREARREKNRAEARAAREKFNREVAALREATKAARAEEAAQRAEKKAADEEATRAAIAAVRAEYAAYEAAKLEAEKAAKEAAHSDWLPGGVERPPLQGVERLDYEQLWKFLLNTAEFQAAEKQAAEPAPAPAPEPAPVAPTPWAPPTPKEVFAQALKSERLKDAPWRDARGVKVVSYKITTLFGGERFSSLGGYSSSYESHTAQVMIAEDGAEVVRPLIDAETSMVVHFDQKSCYMPTSEYLPRGCYKTPMSGLLYEIEHERLEAQQAKIWAEIDAAEIAAKKAAKAAQRAAKAEKAEVKQSPKGFDVLASLLGGKNE